MAEPAASWPLAPGERLLWQGRPDARPRFFARHLMTTVFGALFGLAGAIPLWLMLLLGWPQGLWLVPGVLFCAAMALGLGVLPHVLTARRLGRSAYAITDRRVLIRTDGQTEGWPVGPDMPLGRPWGAVAVAVRSVRRRRGPSQEDVVLDGLPPDQADRAFALLRALRAGEGAPGA